MKQNTLKALCLLMLCLALVIVLAACGDPEVGPQGEKGEKGEDGVSPTVSISEDGYWVINGEKTNVKATPDSSSENENAIGLAFYPKDDGTYAVAVGNAGYLSSITIPSTYRGKAVNEIARDGFEGATNLKSITIPDSIKKIGNSAFSGCASLKSITIPDSVESIGDYAFGNCDKLTSVTIPDSVTCISSSAFSGCDGLTNVTIPDSVTSIGKYAFSGCTSLTSVTIPDSVTCIGDYAFRNCTSLTSVTIPDGVTSIGWYAFNGCTSLTSVTIPDSVTSIGIYAFEGCSSLASVTIPDSAESIGDYAFRNCTSLTSVTIGSGVTSIGDSAFFGCSNLVEVINRSDLHITKGSSDYGRVAYYALEVHTGESKIVNKDGYLFYTVDGVNYLLGYTGEDTELTLPESYNGENYEIHDRAFYLNKSITSVIIPGGVTSIGDFAFYYCTSLTSVTIPDSVTSIGIYAFYDCTSLTSVTIGSGVTSIGDSAFSSCRSLTSVYITDIAAWCNISFGDEVANPLYYAHNLYLNGELVTNLVIPDSVTSIGNRAFYGCTSLTSVYITDIAAWCNISFDSYDTNPLYYAHNLYLNGELVTNLVIPDSVTSIGKYAFEGCTSLTSVTFINPTGWRYASSSTATGGTPISESGLSNASTAATYLKSTYSGYYWNRTN